MGDPSGGLSGSQSDSLLVRPGRDQGVTLVDFLNSVTGTQWQDFQYRMSYAGDGMVGPFYSFAGFLSNLGYPGPDPWFNPSPLTSTNSPLIFHPPLLVQATGRNLSFLGPNAVAPGISSGVYTQKICYSAAYAGGQWAKYAWSSTQLGPHTKISLSIGVVWNGSGVHHSKNDWYW